MPIQRLKAQEKCSGLSWVSSKTVTSQEVASIVGDSELADALIQNSVPYAISDNGRAQNLPVVQVELELETSPNKPSGYTWNQGNGPDPKFPKVLWVRHELLLTSDRSNSYAIASFRWLTGIYGN